MTMKRSPFNGQQTQNVYVLHKNYLHSPNKDWCYVLLATL